MKDLIIIGAGPAGISASLYAKRANFDVLVFYHGSGNLLKAHKIENYYGFPNGISGKDLYQNGIEQAKNLGVEVQNAEVTHIELNDDFTFTITADEKKFKSKALIIATGNKKLRPQIKGIEEFEGKGISYCAICDAFFYRNKNVVVIGSGSFALSEAEALENIVSSVKILTNGIDKTDLEKIEQNLNKKYEIDSRKIIEIKGNEQGTKVKSVIFEDNSELLVDGIFIALGEAGASDFAKKLGLYLKDDSIVVNEKMETNIKGLYSCGNSTGGLLQVSKAVYEGAIAGLNAAEYLKNLKNS